MLIGVYDSALIESISQIMHVLCAVSTMSNSMTVILRPQNGVFITIYDIFVFEFVLHNQYFQFIEMFSMRCQFN